MSWIISVIIVNRISLTSTYRCPLVVQLSEPSQASDTILLCSPQCPLISKWSPCPTAIYAKCLRGSLGGTEEWVTAIPVLTLKGALSVVVVNYHSDPYLSFFLSFFLSFVPAGSPSRGGDVLVCVTSIKQPSLPTHFYYVVVSVSLFMALSTLFHCINSPDNSSLSHSGLPVSILPYRSFQLYISL